MARVVITLDETPANCSLVINGNKIPNVTNIEAAVSLERGPEVSFTCIEGGVDKFVSVHFTPVINEDLKSIEDKVKGGQ